MNLKQVLEKQKKQSEELEFLGSPQAEALPDNERLTRLIRLAQTSVESHRAIIASVKKWAEEKKTALDFPPNTNGTGNGEMVVGYNQALSDLLDFLTKPK